MESNMIFITLLMISIATRMTATDLKIDRGSGSTDENHQRKFQSKNGKVHLNDSGSDPVNYGSDGSSNEADSHHYNSGNSYHNYKYYYYPDSDVRDSGSHSGSDSSDSGSQPDNSGFQAKNSGSNFSGSGSHSQDSRSDSRDSGSHSDNYRSDEDDARYKHFFEKEDGEKARKITNRRPEGMFRSFMQKIGHGGHNIKKNAQSKISHSYDFFQDLFGNLALEYRKEDAGEKTETAAATNWLKLVGDVSNWGDYEHSGEKMGSQSNNCRDGMFSDDCFHMQNIFARGHEDDAEKIKPASNNWLGHIISGIWTILPNIGQIFHENEETKQPKASQYDTDERGLFAKHISQTITHKTNSPGKHHRFLQIEDSEKMTSMKPRTGEIVESEDKHNVVENKSFTFGYYGLLVLVIAVVSVAGATVTGLLIYRASKKVTSPANASREVPGQNSDTTGEKPPPKEEKTENNYTAFIMKRSPTV